MEPRLIDVHSHIVPRMLPADPTGGGIDKWPCVQCQSLTAATVLMGAKPFRQIDERSWDVGRRVADMASRPGLGAGAVADARAPVLPARCGTGDRARPLRQRRDRGDGGQATRPLLRAGQRSPAGSRTGGRGTALDQGALWPPGRRGRQQHQWSLSRRAPVRSVLRRGRGARTRRVRRMPCTRCRRRIWRRRRTWYPSPPSRSIRRCARPA